MDFQLVFIGNHVDGARIDNLFSSDSGVNDIEIVNGTIDKLGGGVSEFSLFKEIRKFVSQFHFFSGDFSIDSGENKFIERVGFDIEFVGSSTSDAGVGLSFGDFLNVNNFTSVFPRNEDDLESEGSGEFGFISSESEIENVDGSSDDLSFDLALGNNFESVRDELLSFFDFFDGSFVDFDVASVVFEIEVSGLGTSDDDGGLS